jgi:hypothetical protein
MNDKMKKIIQLNRPEENNLMSQIEYLTSMLYSQLGITEKVINEIKKERILDAKHEEELVKNDDYKIAELYGVSGDKYEVYFFKKTSRYVIKCHGTNHIMLSFDFYLVHTWINDFLIRNPIQSYSFIVDQNYYTFLLERAIRGYNYMKEKKEYEEFSFRAALLDSSYDNIKKKPNFNTVRTVLINMLDISSSEFDDLMVKNHKFKYGVFKLCERISLGGEG